MKLIFMNAIYLIYLFMKYGFIVYFTLNLSTSFIHIGMILSLLMFLLVFCFILPHVFATVINIWRTCSSLFIFHGNTFSCILFFFVLLVPVLLQNVSIHRLLCSECCKYHSLTKLYFTIH